ncbi:MAG TPA: hypothetical protein VIF09_02220 [Polyangiaceae bacterium]
MARWSIHGVALAILVATSATCAWGCYVEDPPPEYAEGYGPMYYDGYVVYYDDDGRPYYHVNGEVVWVPPSSPVYIGLVHHWHHYGPEYRRWYYHHGYRYHGYHGHRR